MRNILIAGAVIVGICLAPDALAADAKDKKTEKKPAAAPAATAKPTDKASEKGIILQKDAKPTDKAATKGIILQKPADKKAPDAKAKTPGG